MRQRRHFKTKTDNGQRAILYCRVSTDAQASEGVSLAAQASEGVSLAAQEEALRAAAAARGIDDLILLIDGGVSAKSLDRPEFQKALELLKTGERNLLMATKLDRLSRSTADVLDLAAASDREGWALIVLDGAVAFDSQTPQGKLTLTMMAALAQFEREQTAARITEAFRHKRQRGDAGLIPVDLEARIVNLYAAGKSMDKIAKLLNGEGTPTARGGARKWYASTVSRVITRAAKTGAGR